jgi:ribosomal protein S18 acetylase RimI-like enzyme
VDQGDSVSSRNNRRNYDAVMLSQQETGAHHVIAAVPYDHRHVAALTEEVQAYYIEIYGAPDTTPVSPADFAPPLGGFFVGYLDGAPAAMGGWRFIEPRAGVPGDRPAEIKRMYVVKAARGLGLARQMLRHLEVTAREAGADALALETGKIQPAAVRLYRSSGYTDIGRFGYYADKDDAVHLGKLLKP